MSEFNNDNYQSPKSLARLAVGGLGALLVIHFLLILFGLGASFAPYKISAENGESVSIWLGLIGLLALLQLPIYIATAVAFLMWLHRCYKNLPSLKSRQNEFTPGWAVGWWFIPFAQLWKPFQAVRNLWKESNPNFEAERESFPSSGGNSSTIVWWWTFWILSNLAQNLATKLISPEMPDAENAFGPAIIASSLLTAFAAGLAILVVKEITERQEARFAKTFSS